LLIVIFGFVLVCDIFASICEPAFCGGSSVVGIIRKEEVVVAIFALLR